MIQRILRWGPRTVLAIASTLTGLIALIDWRLVFNATLGFLYMFPMVLLGTVLGWWQLILAASFCTFLSDRLDPFPSDMQTPRDILIFLTLATTGLLSRAVTKGYRQVEKEVVARRAAEEQLEFLIESSPAAVLTMTAEAEILLANPAAHRLFGVPPGSLTGRKIARYVPALGSVPSIDEASKAFRTVMQTRGERENGEVFLADVFFSTYRTAAGPRLAALLVDASEHLREREEASLRQLMAGSRIMAAAVSHEVRNVCGAIAVMHENLTRNGTLAGNKDFEALGSLVETLAKIASLELKQSTNAAEPARVDLQELLTDLRIVLESYCEESEIELRLAIPADLPMVQADRHSLLQVLLNLTKNSQRALESVARKVIELSVAVHPDRVSIRIADNGPGIAPGRKLFQPLQKGADATGLGLYLSRSLMRSFRGDLRHDPGHPGCSFVLELQIAAQVEEQDPQAAEHEADQTLTA
ncbi:MAG TPA: ATP-binding protein [Bryobacteraceae bacterium]|nr:ATP-binding protein [Bryobacteraceae bacterium]